jgi:hypothetical protein
MNRWLFLILLLLVEPWDARCQVSDPCSASFLKQTFKATVASATTVLLATGATGKNIHLCGIKVENVGTSGTWALEVGTGSTCGTNTATLTPAFGGTNAAVGTAGNGNTVMGFGNNELLNTGSTLANSNLCVVTTGTLTDVWIFGTYVVQ